MYKTCAMLWAKLFKKKGGLTALPGSTKARWQFGKPSDCKGPEAVSIKQYVPVTHTSHNDNDDKQQYKDQNQSTNKQSQDSKVKVSMTNGQASSRIETRIVHIIVECMHVCWIKHIQSQLNHIHTWFLTYNTMEWILVEFIDVIDIILSRSSMKNHVDPSHPTNLVKLPFWRNWKTSLATWRHEDTWRPISHDMEFYGSMVTSGC